MIQAVGALLGRDGKVLLGLRAASKAICPGCWDAIGGHLEPGESHEDALVRELSEEIGVRPLVFAPLAEFEFGEPWPAHYRLYLVESWDGEPRIVNDEHTALAWFTPEQASRLENLAVAEYRPLLAALKI